jgi:hypothetical protein
LQSSPYSNVSVSIDGSRYSNASWTVSADNLPRSITMGPGKPPMDRRVFFGSLGAAASILTMLSAVFVMRMPGPVDGDAIANAATRPIMQERTASVAADSPAAPAKTPIVAAAETKRAAPAVVAAAPASQKASKGAPWAAAASPDPRPAPKPEAPPPPPPKSDAKDAKGDGSLAAVAVGGSCAFSVNGASKGNQTTLKVSLKPGTYSVSCKSSSGATKSRTVTIKSGETAMAMFKL